MAPFFQYFSALFFDHLNNPNVENKLLISTPNDRSEISLATVDIRDFRWHQVIYLALDKDVWESPFQSITSLRLIRLSS